MRRSRSFKKSYILVFDTSTLIILMELDILDYLRKSIERSLIDIVIPNGVREELRRGGREINLPYTDVDINEKDLEGINDIPRSLGRGEFEAIATAYIWREHSNIIVVSDDKKARSTCERLNLNCFGTLGLLEFLKKNRVITKEEAISILNKIPETSLYIKRDLLDMTREKILHQSDR